MRRRHIVGGLGACVVAAAARPARAAPAAELWDRWVRHDPTARTTPDHSAWSAFLDRHLVTASDGIARVRYGQALSDRGRLDDYIASLEAVPVSALNRTEQFAFWSNLYNALTVRVILAHYPVDSIRDIGISPGVFAVGPWGATLAQVEDTPLTLDDIEHRVLRPIWGDPRVHYAVNCAAVGCPNLQAQAFTGAALSAMLERGAAAYVNHPRGAQVSGGRLTVSRIYDWFQEDFGDSEVGVIGHLRRYAAEPLLSGLAGVIEIDDYRYDWSLNAA